MKLKELLEGISYELLQGDIEIEVSHICWDSRRATKDSMFIATKGKNLDRHEFIEDALKNGAKAIVIDHWIRYIPENVTVIKVENSKIAMAHIASRFFHEPSKGLNLIGITGTNGKTSTSYFIKKIMEECGKKVGVIGTIESKIGEDIKVKTEKLNPTTPDSIELQSMFNEMVSHGVTDVVMEVTSVALENYRVHGCNFEVAVFTNLTQDHLDDHGTMENYKNAKMKLFRMSNYGIINGDDKICEEIQKYATCKILTYGIDKDADLKAKNIIYSLKGVKFALEFNDREWEVDLGIPGKFSVYNALATIGACYSLGFKMEDIISALRKIQLVKGRFEVVEVPKDYLVVVDYAHTPDGLENILTSLKDLKKGDLITVFGCGGDRDNSKRSIMGEIAGKYSDYVVITSDNPRNEDPLKIISQIEAGVKKSYCSYTKLENRREAIEVVLERAKSGDIVLIAGKGHENYQIIKDQVIEFDDVEVVKNFFS
jgi:UDP-N-acetylmuramoyl-L-alanyl-D-glutamate--2,6-diaminopimelate ligase